jgi:hypothetical protein
MYTTKTKFRCVTCEMIEERCECDRYCYICMGQHGVRLCEDGLYYCEACREACDYTPQDLGTH